jgi:ferredoxin
LKTAAVHCFSGTGNTAHAARIVQDALAGGGYVAAYHPVRREDNEAAAPAELHVFLFPVYALAVPHLMASYIRRLPPGQGAPAAVVCTTGRLDPTVRDGYEGGALMQARAMLRRRGYRVFLTDVIDYPASITNILPPPRPDAAASILKDAEAAAHKVADRIVRGEEGIRPCGGLARTGSLLFGALYAGVGRFMLGKLWVADGRCDACGLCARDCPARTIRMIRGRPFWRWRCEGCERCINLCPRAAVQVSIARLIVFSVPLFWNPLVTLGVLVLPPHGWVVAALLHLIAYAAAVVLLDPCAALLERVPVVRALFHPSWTRRFRRYLAPGFDRKS